MASTTGTVGQSNFVFYRHRRSGSRLDWPGSAGVTHLEWNASSGDVCGSVVGDCIGPEDVWPRPDWRLMGNYVTNGEEGKYASVTVAGPVATRVTSQEIHGFYEQVYVRFYSHPRLHVQMQNADVGRGVAVGLVVRHNSVMHADDRTREQETALDVLGPGSVYGASECVLGRVLECGKKTMLVYLQKPDMSWARGIFYVGADVAAAALPPSPGLGGKPALPPSSGLGGKTLVDKTLLDKTLLDGKFKSGLKPGLKSFGLGGKTLVDGKFKSGLEFGLKAGTFDKAAAMTGVYEKKLRFYKIAFDSSVTSEVLSAFSNACGDANMDFVWEKVRDAGISVVGEELLGYIGKTIVTLPSIAACWYVAQKLVIETFFGDGVLIFKWGTDPVSEDVKQTELWKNYDAAVRFINGLTRVQRDNIVFFGYQRTVPVLVRRALLCILNAGKDAAESAPEINIHVWGFTADELAEYGKAVKHASPHQIFISAMHLPRQAVDDVGKFLVMDGDGGSQCEWYCLYYKYHNVVSYLLGFEGDVRGLWTLLLSMYNINTAALVLSFIGAVIELKLWCPPECNLYDLIMQKENMANASLGKFVFTPTENVCFVGKTKVVYESFNTEMPSEPHSCVLVSIIKERHGAKFFDGCEKLFGDALLVKAVCGEYLGGFDSLNVVLSRSMLLRKMFAYYSINCVFDTYCEDAKKWYSVRDGMQRIPVFPRYLRQQTQIGEFYATVLARERRFVHVSKFLQVAHDYVGETWSGKCMYMNEGADPGPKDDARRICGMVCSHVQRKDDTEWDADRYDMQGGETYLRDMIANLTGWLTAQNARCAPYSAGCMVLWAIYRDDSVNVAELNALPVTVRSEEELRAFMGSYLAPMTARPLSFADAADIFLDPAYAALSATAIVNMINKCVPFDRDRFDEHVQAYRAKKAADQPVGLDAAYDKKIGVDLGGASAMDATDGVPVDLDKLRERAAQAMAALELHNASQLAELEKGKKERENLAAVRLEQEAAAREREQRANAVRIADEQRQQAAFDAALLLKTFPADLPKAPPKAANVVASSALPKGFINATGVLDVVKKELEKHHMRANLTDGVVFTEMAPATAAKIGRLYALFYRYRGNSTPQDFWDVLYAHPDIETEGPVFIRQCKFRLLLFKLLGPYSTRIKVDIEGIQADMRSGAFYVVWLLRKTKGVFYSGLRGDRDMYAGYDVSDNGVRLYLADGVVRESATANGDGMKKWFMDAYGLSEMHISAYFKDNVFADTYMEIDVIFLGLSVCVICESTGDAIAAFKAWIVHNSAQPSLELMIYERCCFIAGVYAATWNETISMNRVETRLEYTQFLMHCFREWDRRTNVERLHSVTMLMLVWLFMEKPRPKIALQWVCDTIGNTPELKRVAGVILQR